jgi:hypothetical protein
VRGEGPGGKARAGRAGESGLAHCPCSVRPSAACSPRAAVMAGGPLRRPSLVRGRGAGDWEEIVSRGLGSPEAALAFWPRRCKLLEPSGFPEAS